LLPTKLLQYFHIKQKKKYSKSLALDISNYIFMLYLSLTVSDSPTLGSLFV
jgi:hypothetical protein